MSKIGTYTFKTTVFPVVSFLEKERWKETLPKQIYRSFIRHQAAPGWPRWVPAGTPPSPIVPTVAPLKEATSGQSGEWVKQMSSTKPAKAGASSGSRRQGQQVGGTRLAKRGAIRGPLIAHQSPQRSALIAGQA